MIHRGGRAARCRVKATVRHTPRHKWRLWLFKADKKGGIKPNPIKPVHWALTTYSGILAPDTKVNVVEVGVGSQMSIIMILWLSVPINSCMYSPLWQDADVSPEHDPIPSRTGYSYCVRIIPPKNKKDFLVLDMHNTTQRFQTPLELKTKLERIFCKSRSR